MRIYPKYKITLSYNLVPDQQKAHYQFFLNEFVPGLQEFELYLTEVYQVLWGNYPSRQAEFVAESLDIVRTALASDKFQALEQQFLQHTATYKRRVILYKASFQL